MVCAVPQARHRVVPQALEHLVAVLVLQAVPPAVVGKKNSPPVIDFRLSLLYKGKKVINRGIAYASLYAPNIIKAESVRL